MNAYQLVTVQRTALEKVTQDPRMAHEKEITEVQGTVRKGEESDQKGKKFK